MKVRAVALLLALHVAPATPQDLPLLTNPGTLARSFPLPGLGRSAVLAERAFALDLQLDVLNEYHTERAGGDELLLDGEAARLALRYARGLAGGWEWSIEVPLLSVGGGFMDARIENWHDFFGLPNGGRDLAAQDRYRYRYVRDNAVVFDERDQGTRLGDAQLALGWKARRDLALRALAKLPTGDENRLAGGTAGAALWADWALPLSFPAYLSAGLAGAERGPLGDAQNQVTGFGGAGFGVPLWSRLELAAQIYLHAPLGERGLAALGRPGAPLSFGFTWRASGHSAFDAVVQEDLGVGASPDFSVRLGWRYRAR